jgi:hypothetical protein
MANFSLKLDIHLKSCNPRSSVGGQKRPLPFTSIIYPIVASNMMRNPLFCSFLEHVNYLTTLFVIEPIFLIHTSQIF